MLVILKKPEKKYKEVFKCDFVMRNTELNINNDKCVILSFKLIETKYNKDEMPIIDIKDSDNVEMKNRSYLLNISLLEPYEFEVKEIMIRLNEYDDVDKIIIDHTSDDNIIITLCPGLLSYTFKLVGSIEMLG